jgi:hypothetical protein
MLAGKVPILHKILITAENSKTDLRNSAADTFVGRSPVTNVSKINERETFENCKNANDLCKAQQVARHE